MARSRPSGSRTCRIERLVADKEAERVPGGVQVDPHMFLWLEIRQYGAGFYRLAGSDTCVRLGGGIGTDIGTSGTRR